MQCEGSVKHCSAIVLDSYMCPSIIDLPLHLFAMYSSSEEPVVIQQ